MYPTEPEDKALNLSPKGFASRVYVRQLAPNQVIGNALATTVKLNGVLYDTLGEFDSAAYTFTPLYSGWYAIMAQIVWVLAAQTGDGRLTLETVDGIVDIQNSRGLIPAARDFTQSINTIRHLDKGKLVKLIAWQNVGGGANRSLYGSIGTADFTWMCIHRLS